MTTTPHPAPGRFEPTRRPRWFWCRRTTDGVQRPGQRAARHPAVRVFHHELAGRSQQARHANARAGWWVGPPPYGYRRITHRVRDHSGHLRTRHLLGLDERRAPVVVTIYRWFIDEGLSAELIAQRLAADPDRYPPPLDDATGRLRAWTTGTVRGVLSHPAYTGHTVWGRTTNGRPQPIGAWTWSLGPTHPALINPTQFRATHNRRCEGRRARR